MRIARVASFVAAVPLSLAAIAIAQEIEQDRVCKALDADNFCTELNDWPECDTLNEFCVVCDAGPGFYVTRCADEMTKECRKPPGITERDCGTVATGTCADVDNDGVLECNSLTGTTNDCTDDAIQECRYPN